MILEDNHPFICAGKDLNEFIAPLRQYHIHNFTYSKHAEDGGRIRMTTHPEHLQSFYKNKFYETGNIDAKPTLYENQVVLVSTMPNQFLVDWAAENFNVAHAIYIIRKCGSYNEFFSFATTKNHPEIINFYLNNIDKLQNFCDLFKEQASGLLRAAEAHKIYHPYYQSLYQYDTGATEAKKVIRLTKRQQDLLKQLLKGLSSKEIARELMLSPRTVEDHIATMKVKFAARNLKELLLKLAQFQTIHP